MAAERAKSRSVTEQFRMGPWLITTRKSHILESEGPQRQAFESSLRLPQVPEMIFADNVLRIQHDDGFGLEFSALDALKLVDADHDPLKVAVSEAWKEARADCEHINDVHKPFDWTYTTDYMGTLLHKGHKMNVTETSDRIDLEKLKQREKIMFYDDIVLFEDELADNGASVLNIKIRVMPASFFLLMRQFMRVDNVIIRVNDTRVYHEADKNYFLREFTSRDDKVADMKATIMVEDKWAEPRGKPTIILRLLANIPKYSRRGHLELTATTLAPGSRSDLRHKSKHLQLINLVKAHLFTDPNEMAKCLTVRKEIFQKLEFPESSKQNTAAS